MSTVIGIELITSGYINPNSGKDLTHEVDSSKQ